MFVKGHPDIVPREARIRAGKKISIAQKGKITSIDTKRKQSISASARVGKFPRGGKMVACKKCGKEKWKYPRDIKKVKNNFCSKECAYSVRKGISFSPSTQFTHENNSKEKSKNWKGGITPINNQIRGSLEYKLWSDSVWNRDGNCCQKCGEHRISKLVAHHILNFSSHIELRFAIDNGITFCRPCHKAFHQKYNVRNNTREQINEFLSVV